METLNSPKYRTIIYHPVMKSIRKQHTLLRLRSIRSFNVRRVTAAAGRSIIVEPPPLNYRLIPKRISRKNIFDRKKCIVYYIVRISYGIVV